MGYLGTVFLVTTASMSGWMTWKGASDSSLFGIEHEASQSEIAASSDVNNPQLDSIDGFVASKAAFDNFMSSISERVIEVHATAEWLGDVPLFAWAMFLPMVACVEIFLAGWILRR